MNKLEASQQDLIGELLKKTDRLETKLAAAEALADAVAGILNHLPILIKLDLEKALANYKSATE